MCENMARIYDLRGTSEENVKEDLAQLQISVAYFCSIGLYFLV